MKDVFDRWNGWWEETHSSGFELRRHFFQRFFDSDLVASEGQWKVVAIGTLGIVASLAIVLGQAYFRKYRFLLGLDSPEPYRIAMIADHLFFITLAMLLTGLLTTLLWSSLFPGLRDYLALNGLPIRPWSLFLAKLAALLAFVGTFIAFMNALPSVMLPSVSQGRYQDPQLLSAFSLFAAASLAALFLFFVLVTLQGILLNVIPISMAASTSLLVQGVLLIVTLCCLPLALSIPGLAPIVAAPPDYVTWLPPAWFLGLDQRLLGNRSTLVIELANRALLALVLSALSTAAAYVWSYKRHRIRVIESPVESRPELPWMRRLLASMSDWIIPHPPEQGVFAFLLKTLSRSQQHRLILTAFAGLAAAIILNVFVSIALDAGFRGFRVRTLALSQAAVSVPQALALFLLAGFRYLFRLPVELRANWVFRVNEGGHRLLFLSAVERFLRWAVVIPVPAVTLPIQIQLMGLWAGCASAILCLMTSLVLMELLLFPLERIPFTSSYLPGQRPVVETLMIYMAGVSIYVYTVSWVIVACAEEVSYTAILFGLLLAGWSHLRQAREDSWLIGKLEFEEVMEPVVHTLSIDKD